MIDEIQVQNLALIREATLEPSPGLTVLTGETGAGKTALLSALKLLMGARASADYVRDGEQGLVVAGRFIRRGTHAAPVSAADDAQDAVQDEASEGDVSEELVVTRSVSAEGRSRATVDGVMASARELGELVGSSIDLCGQFEHQQLMRPATHVRQLDTWAGEPVAKARAAYAQAFAEAAQAADELKRVREAQETSQAKVEDARFVLARIDEVQPVEGEYEQLEHDLKLAEHAETLARGAATAHAALSDESGALDALYTAQAALEAAGRHDAELLALVDSLREAGFIMEDVAAQARDYRDKIDFDPGELALQQERFSLLNGLLRTYGPRMEDVFARRAEAAELVSLVGDSDARLREAAEALDAAEARLAEAADALDEARAAAAPRFAAEVSSVMARLNMPGAALVCAQERLPRTSWTATGPSSFEFLYRPAEGAQSRPLARIASGGEVSRVMLATKVVLGNTDDVDTLVFDEVDAGVGGATAVALADVIADLADTHQVIVVTHLAQVAVRADTHYIVRREGAETSLASVEGPDREREIARMLSGSTTETSLAHARELLGS